MLACKAAMDLGSVSSRGRVSMPRSARSEILDVVRAVAKTRRPVCYTLAQHVRVIM
jgi:hypothetical protein